MREYIHRNETILVRKLPLYTDYKIGSKLLIEVNSVFLSTKKCKFISFFRFHSHMSAYC